MPQHATAFFFITCQTCEPFVAKMSQNWMVAQWYMYQVPLWRFLGSIPGTGILERAIFCLSVPLYCCTDLRFFGVVLTCQVLRILKLPVPLLENDGTLDQQLEACHSMPQHAAASQNFLGDRWCLFVSLVEVSNACPAIVATRAKYNKWKHTTMLAKGKGKERSVMHELREWSDSNLD